MVGVLSQPKQIFPLPLSRFMLKAFAMPLAVLMACCSGNTRKQADHDTAAQQPKKVVKQPLAMFPVDSSLTHFSRFIAGMQNPIGRTKSAFWAGYAAANDQKWKTLQDHIGSPIQSWVKQAALEKSTDPKTLFYPFAGGDYYYAHSFFPNADTVIMIGLEPVGSVFDPNVQTDTDLAVYCQNLPNSLFFPHRLGFFRTKSMAVDFRKGLLNGTLHTVLFYLARFDAKIHYLNHFNLDKEGKEVALVNQPKQSAMAYRIGYSLPGDSQVRTVVYLSYDASNQNLAVNPQLMLWLNRRDKVQTFFKAASYLMHYDAFSTIRSFVSAHTVRLLQDDSGLPYRFMVSNGFDVTLLGAYTRTIALFGREFQPDLKAAYEKAKPATLPFLIGYNAEFKECNLQSARKAK
jgi:hypothetical protein